MRIVNLIRVSNVNHMISRIFLSAGDEFRLAIKDYSYKTFSDLSALSKFLISRRAIETYENRDRWEMCNMELITSKF